MGRSLPLPDTYKLPHDVDLAALAVKMIPIVGKLLENFPESLWGEVLDSDQLYEMLKDTGLGCETVHDPVVDGPIEEAEAGDTVLVFTAEALQIREIYRNAKAHQSRT